MPKRKRDDTEDGGRHNTSSTVDSRQLGQFRATIDRSQKSLVAALKLARGFERQKMGRRQKNAAKDPRNLLQRREEVIVLKQLDLDKTAKNHIVKGLLKSKRARESPTFTVVYGSDPKLDSVSTIEGVVLGRLFNSNPVKQAMPRIMAGLFEALGIDDISKKAGDPTEDSKKKEEQHGSPAEPLELDPMEITDDDEEEYSDVDEDSGSSNEGSARIGSAPSEEYSDEGSRSEDLHRAPSPIPKARKLKRHASPPPITTKTAFLPSLNAGYYSGSDQSDDEDAANRDTSLPKERNNRRGQRARQQLAELKYGKNAKHLQKQKSSRDAGWDHRKGAVGVADRGRGKKSSSRPSPLDGPVKAPKPKVRDDTGPIHPSWEAAKQRKLQSAAPAAFAGKKITFD